jgi:fatty-acyl-CoA synthase
MDVVQQKSLSYASGTASIHLLGQCIGQVLNESARKFPEREALVVRHQQLRFTYSDLHAEVDRLARGFLALGIDKGDRIGIWSTNSSEWIINQFAAARVGALLVNINPANRDFELEYVLGQSECQTLLLIDGFRDINYIDTVRRICPEVDQSEPGKLTCKALPNLRNLIYVGGNRPPGMFSWKDVMRFGAEAPQVTLHEREARLEFDEAINIQYTSGTTGFPKGATLTHHNIVNNAVLIADAMRLTEQDRLCIPVPFYHCFGMVLGIMACVVSGAAMIIPAAYFDADKTLRAVAEERCTALHGVPTMFIAELEHPTFGDFDLTSLRTGIMAGAPCPLEIMKRVVSEMHCTEITIAYGLTESSPVITQTTPDDPVELRVSTVGKALPHTEVKIASASTGKIVPVGEPGELCTRGYQVMKGYYKNSEATGLAIDEDGWLHSGDLAVMDEHGYFRITGRAKDMIIRGGENIYPREVEEFLYTCPGVSDVQVVGIPDRRYGELVVAWIKLEEGSTITEQEIRAFCKGKIARFKIPKYIKFVTEFPQTVTGKVQKFKMRETMVRELGRVTEVNQIHD